MDKETIKAYATRITQANQSELVVIVYEIILLDIQDAKQFHKEEEYKSMRESIAHAVKMVNELITTLNFKYSVSYNLMELYIYCNKLLLQTNCNLNYEQLLIAENILQTLKKGFDGIKEEDLSEPVMCNTQQVYAGLTYTKGQLNETYIDSQRSRGFKA